MKAKIEEQVAPVAGVEIPHCAGRPQLFWSEKTLCDALDIGRNLLWQRISSGAYPPPEKMPDDRGEPSRTNRWNVKEVMAWIAAGMPHFKSWKESHCGVHLLASK